MEGPARRFPAPRPMRLFSCSHQGSSRRSWRLSVVGHVPEGPCPKGSLVTMRGPGAGAIRAGKEVWIAMRIAFAVSWSLALAVLTGVVIGIAGARAIHARQVSSTGIHHRGTGGDEPGDDAAVRGEGREPLGSVRLWHQSQNSGLPPRVAKPAMPYLDATILVGANGLIGR